MRILDDTKLDFNDVLIAPKRSQLTSRKDAELSRQFTFKHSPLEWTGVPIVASNMDHTGTVQMYHALSAHKMLTALCKFIDFPKDEYQYLSEKGQQETAKNSCAIGHKGKIIGTSGFSSCPLASSPRPFSSTPIDRPGQPL